MGGGWYEGGGGGREGGDIMDCCSMDDASGKRRKKSSVVRTMGTMSPSSMASSSASSGGRASIARLSDRALSNHLRSSSGSKGLYSRCLFFCTYSLFPVIGGLRVTGFAALADCCTAVFDVCSASRPSSSHHASIPPFRRIGGRFRGFSSLKTQSASCSRFKEVSLSLRFVRSKNAVVAVD